MPRIELIHPMIIHFPIALFLAAVGFEIISLFTNKDLFQKIAFANYVLASIAVILAVIFGTISANTIPHNEQIHEVMETHQLLGWITMGLFIVLTIWNYLVVVRKWRKLPLLYWIVVLIAAGSITWGATIGGEMVYNQGAAVQPLYEQFEEAEAGHHHHGESDEAEHEELDHNEEHSGEAPN